MPTSLRGTIGNEGRDPDQPARLVNGADETICDQNRRLAFLNVSRIGQFGTHRSGLCLLQIDPHCLGLADLDGRRQDRDRVEGCNPDLQMSYSRAVTA